MDDLLSRPILLIGAGRSGSTLFSRILNAHPRIHYFGETNFLVARLWREAWEDRFWLNSSLYVKGEPRSSREDVPTLDSVTLKKEEERVAAAVRSCFGEIMQLRADVDAWGYNEIWNGNDAVARIAWDGYDAVFPRAIWVHLIRNPFDFLISLARWNLFPITEKFIVWELKHWVEMFAWNRERQARMPRYFEIRYETLVSEPRAVLAPILDAAGVAWDGRCLDALNHRVLSSKRDSVFRPLKPLDRRRLERLVGKIDGLSAALSELGYAIPDEFPLEEESADATARVPKMVDLRVPTRVQPL